MKKSKEFKDLSVSEKMKLSEKLGAKVAIIINKTAERCNKILKPIGCCVNIKVEFCRLVDEEPAQETKTEMTNG